MPNGTGLDRFQPIHPDKYFDVGIAEEHAVLFAAGMAAKGLKPFCAIYSTFLQRAFDPIVHDVCLQNLPVVFCMDRGGLSADDGPTHHGLFDISYLRAIPNLVHMVPKDEDELADMLFTAMKWDGPIAVRYPRGLGPGTPVKDVPRAIPIGKAELLQHGEQRPRGHLRARLAGSDGRGDRSQAGGAGCIGAAVINARFAKPLDVEMLEFFARTVEVILTLEDHVLQRRVRQRRAGGARTTWACHAGGAYRLARPASSSTASWSRCARNTALPRMRPWRSWLPTWRRNPAPR